ncbi:UvrD-helicase domain-containing protein [Mucilaginibacter daejeonensis]|uniref:UvrD-helicase domain-containing protein n=1 Tax=Mucilaginibacter daejeonensis TaxID=398049 RepID=UPI001D171A47|nr:UvrD-helicase domain-containing protein [Mucilaginibacter daejeonensis]UEG51487.1 UvrD-helicase domain-containing protein [Mucilaginibacter daejeonensis]
MSVRRYDTTRIIKTMLLVLSVVGIWFLYKRWLFEKKIRPKLLALIGDLGQADIVFNSLVNFDRYFAYYDEQRYLNRYLNLRNAIHPEFEKVGLEEEQMLVIRSFIYLYDHAASIRRTYNDEFVIKEREKFAYLFDRLEPYPLSDEQIDAIIRDEDNNLVIAGAGTGKTTTISGKVAYLLEKKLATPQELLVISFTNNAVTEMYQRSMRFCEGIPGADQLQVKTFNGYGNMVTRHCSTDEIRLAFDGVPEYAKTFLQASFDALFLNDRDFQKKAVNFITLFARPERDEFGYESKDEYLRHEKNFDNTTLDGVRVKSKEEMEIANFFCLFGLNYEYQKHFPLNEEDRDPTRGPYQPDFYLTDHQIWHEHYGIDRNGDVPKWFNTKPPYHTAREYYHAGINWKEEIHQKYETKFIKTYSFENKEGVLISNLKKRLSQAGVELKHRSPEQLLEMVKKYVYYEEFMNLVYTFLGLMKSNGKTPEELSAIKGDRRLKVFLGVFSHLYKAYQSELQRTRTIDFNDMIIYATKHLANGRFTESYKYILVDEFQDMSLGRYELLKAVRKQNPGVKIYAVGDDWQSIFRFTGSDISIITEFEKHFGYTSKTAILKTYRFNDQILDVSSRFIQRNPSQLKKRLKADHVAKAPSFSFYGSSLNGSDKVARNRIKEEHINNILTAITDQDPKATVFLIGRYQRNIPTNYITIKRRFPGLAIEYHTAHKVKGMTCDHAILLDVDSGPYGFPSEIADDPMLSYLLHEGDKFDNAEERRVFYVAITRARHQNYLLYNKFSPSKFVMELQENLL